MREKIRGDESLQVVSWLPISWIMAARRRQETTTTLSLLSRGLKEGWGYLQTA